MSDNERDNVQNEHTGREDEFIFYSNLLHKNNVCKNTYYLQITCCFNFIV